MCSPLVDDDVGVVDDGEAPAAPAPRPAPAAGPAPAAAVASGSNDAGGETFGDDASWAKAERHNVARSKIVATRQAAANDGGRRAPRPPCFVILPTCSIRSVCGWQLARMKKSTNPRLPCSLSASTHVALLRLFFIVYSRASLAHWQSRIRSPPLFTFVKNVSHVCIDKQGGEPAELPRRAF